MRIISGSAKGRKINSPKGKVRPLRAQVREALFNILTAYDYSSFLDIFAGTGAVGLEALSRGYEKAAFIEISGKNCKLISRNINELGFAKKQTRVIRKNVFYFLKADFDSDFGFDVVFMGTPYIDDVIEKLFDKLEEIINIVNHGGVLIIQIPTSCKIPIPEILKPRKYGGDILLFYHK
ncbi:MAG: 16S rRNA (guanine(966)-N(2))-methyltransferase RsmD [Candidatus Zixiibacteriota bacterium]